MCLKIHYNDEERVHNYIKRNSKPYFTRDNLGNYQNKRNSVKGRSYKNSYGENWRDFFSFKICLEQTCAAGIAECFRYQNMKINPLQEIEI